jgi:hypothetical protein
MKIFKKLIKLVSFMVTPKVTSKLVPQVKITEALAKLAPYGVENIEQVNPKLDALWKVTKNGKTLIFGGYLEYVVEDLKNL